MLMFIFNYLEKRIFRVNLEMFIKFFIFKIKFSTEKQILQSSKTHTNKFERSQTDVFEINCVDVGDLKKIKLDILLIFEYSVYTCRELKSRR